MRFGLGLALVAMPSHSTERRGHEGQPYGRQELGSVVVLSQFNFTRNTEVSPPRLTSNTNSWRIFPASISVSFFVACS